MPEYVGDFGQLGDKDLDMLADHVNTRLADDVTVEALCEDQTLLDCFTNGSISGFTAWLRRIITGVLRGRDAKAPNASVRCKVEIKREQDGSEVEAQRKPKVAAKKLPRRARLQIQCGMNASSVSASSDVAVHAAGVGMFDSPPQP